MLFFIEKYCCMLLGNGTDRVLRSGHDSVAWHSTVHLPGVFTINEGSQYQWLPSLPVLIENLKRNVVRRFHRKYYMKIQTVCLKHTVRHSLYYARIFFLQMRFSFITCCNKAMVYSTKLMNCCYKHAKQVLTWYFHFNSLTKQQYYFFNGSLRRIV
jgi:hypothetical protein